MELGLKGKKALVIGASSGLGLATATALTAEGAAVTISSRSAERLEKAAAAVRAKSGSTPRFVAGDIRQAEDIKRLIAAVGEVDILVSNCGGPPPGPFASHSIEDWRKAGDLVLQSAINLTREVLPGMISRKWGRLIYITSIAVLQPVDDLILSNTYRAGVTGFCKTISNTHARYGITANTVCPGYTATERLWDLARKRAETSGRTPEEEMTAFGAGTPSGRVGQPEELAALIAFLASDRAAYITGTSIPVDGGAYKGLL